VSLNRRNNAYDGIKVVYKWYNGAMSILFSALQLEHLEKETQHQLTGAAAADLDAIRAAPNEYNSRHDELQADLATIRADSALSETGRAAAAAAELETWRAAAEKLLETTTGRLERALRARQSTATLPPLDPNPSIAAQRLSAAREDARMALEPVAPRELIARLTDLATSDETPDVRHLLLAPGGWGALYLESRGVHERATWEAARLEAVRPLLSPQAARALDELEAFKAAADIPNALKALHASRIALYGLPRAPGGVS
jgi:hypothetical protein